jgi:hypothetical protein
MEGRLPQLRVAGIATLEGAKRFLWQIDKSASATVWPDAL